MLPAQEDEGGSRQTSERLAQAEASAAAAEEQLGLQVQGASHHPLGTLTIIA